MDSFGERWDLPVPRVGGGRDVPGDRPRVEGDRRRRVVQPPELLNEREWRRSHFAALTPLPTRVRCTRVLLSRRDRSGESIRVL
jgi:hypothetical protein